MKRYIYILVGIVVLAVIVVLGLYFWKQYSSTTPTTAGVGTTGTLPSTGTQGSTGSSGSSGSSGTAGSTGSAGASSTTGTSGVVAGSFGPLSNDPVLNYYVAPNNTVLAIEPNGVIAQIVGGQTSYLSTSTATNVIAGSFSADGKKALLAFGNPSNPQTAVFDVASAQWSALPQGMQSASWSPVAGDERIAYLVSAASGTEALAMINAASPKSGSVGVTNLYANDLTVQWVGKTQFVLSDKPSSEAPGSSLFFNSSQGTLMPIALNVGGIESIWTGPSIPASVPMEGLISYASAGGSNVLDLVNNSGGVLQNTTLQTLPSKCAFAMASSSVSSGSSAPTITAATPTATSSTYLALYCGIPRSGSGFASANLPDDYNQMALFTSDDIDSINTQTGSINPLWNDDTQNVDVSDVKTSGNEVFFIDRYTSKLFTLTIAPQQ